MNKLITVFGGTGFVGQEIIKRLIDKNYTIRIPIRNLDSLKKIYSIIKIDPTKIIPIPYENLTITSIQNMIKGSDSVINLLGILYEKGNNTFKKIHIKVASNIAKACTLCSINKFLHMSALGIEKNTESNYALSKYRGEIIVSQQFDRTIIFRPSIIFGPNDNFINKFTKWARMFSVLPIIGISGYPIIFNNKKTMKNKSLITDTSTKFQPVYVGDVADAFIKVIINKYNNRIIYQLGGPRIYSFLEVIIEILVFIKKQYTLLIPIPFWLAKFQAFFMELLENPLLTIDQIRMLQTDSIVSEKSVTFSSLNILPQSIQEILPSYL